ncbi:leucine-rich repeat-containing protein 36 isoform X5 [Canis lupus baileyi]|uniref:leucine-rich repeat-containing protein 36 isoform X5 n=1 Tax=Canis lupus familiaris TaxID=9615 RepID=UPI0003ADDC81|nr:leucine-rich repeat-containing protein 36 isoform X5 [Canis lupus familiaris]XP_025282294.1 leucine-rich repeat-containing protein 36 isoform X5 [Canis lupus dingo]XP_038523295.1 leucine-rich repeat-containing protein 36 isoform X5 [Canis lupus familiaris]|eukprot:XP_005620887.1 leucine-rich repeat-containing protein 36 isoform X5 [Canis lupus familiaris]
MAEQWDLDEEGVRRLGALTLEQPELVESLSLQGSYAGKIHSIGDAFRNFKNLRSLDLSRNLITSLKGIQYLCSLQELNLYYNNIPSLVEVSRLQPLPFLKELDLRLNPVVRKDTDYRLFAVYTLQTLEKLDDRAVRESERKAAKLHFSQLGNSENFLLEVEKSSREKTMKNCVTDESSTSKINANVDNRIETDSNKGLFIPFPNREIKDSLTSTSATQDNAIPDQKLDTFPLGTQEVARREIPSDNHQEDEFRRYSPRQSTVRSPEKMTREGYRLSFLDNKSSGSSPEKDLILKPDTYQLTHDVSLGKRLDVGDSSQIHPYQLPSDVCLENYDSHYSQNLCLHGSLGKRPQRSKNYREYSIKPSNDTKATTSHSCGDLLTSLSNPDSGTGRLLKLSSDLYATTHFNSDPALLVNAEQQLSTSVSDLTPAHGSFPNNPALGDSLRTLLLPTGTSEHRESLTKRSLSPSRRGFKRKDNILAALNPKIGFRDATGSEWCHSHPEDMSKTFRRREMELKEAGHVVPNDMESLKQKLVRVLEENLILSEKIQQLEEGAATLVVSGHQSHTYDDLLRKNQQLNMQVACLNQELAQLKKLEETVALLHESQRSLVVTNEYLLQQLNKEQKGYSGKALLPPEKSHHSGRSSPFGKSTLTSSSPVAHDTGSCRSCQRKRQVERLHTYLLP